MNMHIASDLLCFVVVSRMGTLPMYFRITPMVAGNSYDFCNLSKHPSRIWQIHNINLLELQQNKTFFVQPLSKPNDDVIKWKHFLLYWPFVRGINRSPVTGEFPAQRPMTRTFDAFFDLRLNKRLDKQSWSWWFETPSHPLWRHCNA